MDSTSTASSRDDMEHWMEAAHELAKEALTVGEVPIGCVVVHNGQLVCQGRNQTNATRNPTKHAEMVAFDDYFTTDSALSTEEKEAILRQSKLYVNCEPCIMCAAAIRQLGITEVFFGCANDRFGGCGSVLPVHSKPELKSGVPFKATAVKDAAEKAVVLLKEFYKQGNPNAPPGKRKR
ncbi:putative tRNA-specific adenosine deaminase 2 [Hypsibius exemplaris]|uniref:tRNA-specific adenosine deaminase 2 n=1 Tax=Hypsibius exemplaris TaxID=2072580 RepID=A0A1W0WLE2_HYPEX|nr:putative tRNA-specific adenosine deaminase 2 [Hypsibius exemplaris]